MGRKINDNEIPARHQWLHNLADIGLFKAMLIIWGITWATILIVFVILKWVIFNRH